MLRGEYPDNFPNGEDESQAVLPKQLSNDGAMNYRTTIKPKQLGNDGAMKYRTTIQTGHEEMSGNNAY